MFFHRNRRRRGFGLAEVLIVGAIVAGAHSEGNYTYAINEANRVKGVHNLKQIYTILQIESMTDRLPSPAFYPKGDPKTDPTSIVRIMKDVPPEMFISPFAPEALKKTGLTFVWNDTVNGKQLDQLPKGTWLMIDIAAFITDPNVPKPTSYLVLYANGDAMAVDTLPPDIVKAVQEAQEKGKK